MALVVTSRRLTAWSRVVSFPTLLPPVKRARAPPRGLQERRSICFSSPAASVSGQPRLWVLEAPAVTSWCGRRGCARTAVAADSSGSNVCLDVRVRELEAALAQSAEKLSDIERRLKKSGVLHTLKQYGGPLVLWYAGVWLSMWLAIFTYLQLSVRREEYVISLDKTVGQTLGLQLVPSSDGSATIIDSILPGGLVEQWNAQQHCCGEGEGDEPLQRRSSVMRPGDVLEGVNAVEGDTAQLLDECLKSKSVLLRLSREDTPWLSPLLPLLESARLDSIVAQVDPSYRNAVFAAVLNEFLEPLRFPFVIATGNPVIQATRRILAQRAAAAA